ncbi:MAG: hypothetical protein ACOC44_01695 [Promethearchaeia archaeon]
MKLNRRKTFLFTFLVLNLFTVLLTVDVYAQSSYSVDISQDDEFTWEVKELNHHNFKKVFGFEPGFKEGDRLRIRITDVIDTSYGWNIITQYFDYGSDFTKNGTVETYSLYETPEEYSDNIFIPAPAEDFLEEASEFLPTEYTVRGLRVIKQKNEYKLEMEYNAQGVKTSETYIDENGIILIKIEGLFTIPMGNYFMGFLAISVIGLIAIMIKKKTMLISNSE